MIMKKEQNKQIERFLSQNYTDAWADFFYSQKNTASEKWDWVILTASNEKQAQYYKGEIDQRISEGRIPSDIRYAVVPDINGKRTGSGGATLNVIRYIIEHSEENVDIRTQKILLIHSGGDSKRIPQYSICGKLFSPIPHILPTGHISTLFDEILITMSALPSRMSAGMLIAPGDSEIIYNPLQIDLANTDAAALSIKADLIEGKEHGVFLNGVNNIVSKFLHKLSESELIREGAVDNRGKVDIDTGYIWIGPNILQALSQLIVKNDTISDELCKKYINDTVRLSFYADIIYPIATESTLANYLKETPEGDFSLELESCRKEIWDKLHRFTMKLLRLNPAKYIHLGSTWELFETYTKNITDYAYLGWTNKISCNASSEKIGTCINCLVNPKISLPQKSYCEDSIIGENTIVGNNSILSNVNISNIRIPENIVLHTVELDGGRYSTQIYGYHDNPKVSISGPFLGKTLSDFLRLTNEKTEGIWTDNKKSLWTAKIYPVCHTEQDSINAALGIWRIMNEKHNQADIDNWKKAEKISLDDGLLYADLEAINTHKRKIRNLVLVRECIDILQNPELDLDVSLASICGDTGDVVKNLLLQKITELDTYTKMRIYLLLAHYCKKNQCDYAGYSHIDFEEHAYAILADSIVSEAEKQYPLNIEQLHFVESEATIKLPVRINFCGSPSDAAPYCTTYGGTMLNVAISLEEKLPISVTAKRLNEPIIRFISEDGGLSATYSEISDILDSSVYRDSFSLYKAVLIASGIIPRHVSISLNELLKRIGGGIEIKSSVNIPKGSGLGTSSILAAACIKAVSHLFGLKCDNDLLFSRVFVVEQLMGTGGGWQDQVGGATSGIKLITSKPGISQKLSIDYLQLDEKVKKELQNRFVLIFSGQRRLAKNVLRQEMNAVLTASKETRDRMRTIEELAVLMKFDLEKGDVDKFGTHLTEQFKIVKLLDKGASNTYIEYIFDVCDDLIAGKSICGAGGGGFLQVILKKGVTKNQLSRRLSEIFGDTDIKIWNSEFIYPGDD